MTAPLNRPPTKTVRGTFLRAAAILETAGWTRKAYARDAKGRRVKPTSPGAACFCLAGACRRACGDSKRVSWAVELAVVSALPASHGSGGSYNDAPRRTKRDCIAFLRRVARLERGVS